MKEIKKIGLLLLVLCSTITANAQKKYKESTKAIIEEVKTVISITDEQAKQLYDLELEKYKSISDVRTKYKDEKQKKQAGAKLIYAANEQAYLKVIGKDKLDTLRAYKKEKKKNKKKNKK